MREILDHRSGLDDLNTQLRVDVTDEPDQFKGEVNNVYQPYVKQHNQWEKLGLIRFQKGPFRHPPGTDITRVAPVQPNGVSLEVLLAIAVDRLRNLQKTSMNCRENAEALNKIEEALHWLHARTRERTIRQVEGTRQP